MVTAACVAEAADVSGELTDTTVTFAQTADMEDTSVFAVYDNQGNLEYANVLKVSDGKFSVTLPNKAYIVGLMRAYFPNKDIAETVKVTLPTKAPTATATPTASPAAAATASPASTSYPSVYPKQGDATNAFAVCEKVSSVQNSDGGDAYDIEAYWQGKEADIIVNADVMFNSASDQFASMNGATAASLKKGDVFHFNYNLAKTRVTAMDFIYRPGEKNIATNDTDYGTNFEKMFTYNGIVSGFKNWLPATYGKSLSSEYMYAFGIITDKTSTSITLMNKAGKVDNALEIPAEKGTIVYLCDESEKDDITVTSVAGIPKTYVPKDQFDNTAVDWTKADNFEYAFVRIIDGTATDIIVFENSGK